MTKPRTRSFVSLASALSLALTLGACASGASRHVLNEPTTPAEASAATVVRFDNGAREHVHVYLIGEQREWLLGRVEPGARATLRIPDDALAGNTRSMRLAVVAGQRVTMRAASEARAITLVQPASVIVSQKWTFSQTPTQGQLTALQLGFGGMR